MSNDHELPSDSDDSDEDYVPGGVDDAPGSEAESEGEAESAPEDGEDEALNKSDRLTKGKGKGKKRAGKSSAGGRKKSRRASDDEETKENEKEAEGDKKLSEEEEKKKADSLWADFMKDTPAVSKPKPKSSEEPPSLGPVRKEPVEKVKITKLFEFAGEEVRVEKEVPADSAEARLTLPSSTDSKPDPQPFGGRGGRKGGLGGISSVLGQLGKKAKISTLEKSKLDWDSYKKEENIEEEISTHNKGKDGYLGRQDFLQRTDLRQFEIEKQLRTTKRSTR